jgi:hypothetical protein
MTVICTHLREGCPLELSLCAGEENSCWDRLRQHVVQWHKNINHVTVSGLAFPKLSQCSEACSRTSSGTNFRSQTLAGIGTTEKGKPVILPFILTQKAPILQKAAMLLKLTDALTAPTERLHTRNRKTSSALYNFFVTLIVTLEPRATPGVQFSFNSAV